MPTVLIVDDHRLIRDALTDLFAETPDIQVVGQCADGDEVVAAVGRTRPDVVLMDLQMPRVDGLTAARAVLAAHPWVRVVVLTGGLTHGSACEARAIGVAGYLLKDDDPAELPGHVRVVAAGGTAWHRMTGALFEESADPPAARSAAGGSSPHVDACPEQFR
ncbi:response regulator transcription factor [Geodermatophilus sp. SYSU D00742]